MTARGADRIAAPGIGEVPPTAGLPPRWRDLLVPGAGPSLEQALSRRLGVPELEIVSTGTAGLRIAFTWAAARSPGRDVVIVPAYTCPLVVLAAAAAGLRCVACDTVQGGLDLDPAHLARLVDARTTLAIVPTHYGGALTDVATPRVIAAAVSPDIAIVEDAAQALGATRGGRSVGLEGDVGVFSLGAGKGLTIYEGGVLVARDAAAMNGLRSAIARLARRSVSAELHASAMLAGYHAAYNALGLRLAFGAGKRRALATGDDIGAAGDRFAPGVEVTRVGAHRKRIGRSALGRLDAHLAASRTRFALLAERLAAVPGLTVHRPRDGDLPSSTFLLVSLPDRPGREELVRALWASRLGVARLFSRALPDYPDLSGLLLPSATPHARAFAASTVTISTAGASTEDAQRAILDALTRFARE